MKLINTKSTVVFSAETTDCYLGLGNVTIIYTVKTLRKSYGPPVTLSRLFQFKKLMFKESINYYDRFNK